MTVYTPQQIRSRYEYWRENAKDALVRSELYEIEKNEEEISDRFYTDLAFGTGGLRGMLGAGENRMNVYTVAKAAKGFADYLNSLPAKNRKSVAIARDSRINSDLFARVCACVLAYEGIGSFSYPNIAPTPALSFAVRYLGCDGGICITASHNPCEYNGFKAYGPDGCQITSLSAMKIQKAINAVDVFKDIPESCIEGEYKSELILNTPPELIKVFVGQVTRRRLCLDEQNENVKLKLVYTPLNGSGLEAMSEMFEQIGFNDYTLVASQKDPDGNFPTCPYPNPEMKEALSEGLKQCEKTNADILIATDPDSDRVAIAVAYKGEYKIISGNELGMLLFEYICAFRTKKGIMPPKPVMITTIVSTLIVDRIAEKYGVEVKRTLTGFKYIGEQITKLEEEGRQNDFIFGFEESCGYLIGDYARDKDAIGAAMMLYDMAVEAKKKGSDLYEVSQDIYREYGFCETLSESFSFAGEDGLAKINGIMESLRRNPLKNLLDEEVVGVKDYLSENTLLPPSDVMEFASINGLKLIIRPSGTEPKIKAYLFAHGSDHQAAEKKLKDFKKFVSFVIMD